jgi:hypothetical protein
MIRPGIRRLLRLPLRGRRVEEEELDEEIRLHLELRAERLVAVFATEAGGSEGRNPTSPANFLDWKQRSRTLERMTAAHSWSPTLTGGEIPLRVAGLRAE